MKNLTTINLKNIFTTAFFVFGFFLVAPQTTFAECSLLAGQFRTASHGVNIPEDWFESSYSQNSTQPFIYLDLSFSPDCTSNNIVKTQILEYDFIDPNDEVTYFQDLTMNTGSLQQTLTFIAGDSLCDSGCEYFLLLEIDGEERSFSPSNGQSLLNIEYECSGSCDDQIWVPSAHVSSVNAPGYEYGNYISTIDPYLLNSQQEGNQTNEGTQEGNQTNEGTQEGNQTNTIVLSVSDLEQIENPLGPGGNIPSFIQSLLGIIVRAGIPLVVLALVYTGFLFVYSRGNPEKLLEAKQALLWSVVGTAVLLGAWTIATILNNTVSAIISSITSFFV